MTAQHRREFLFLQGLAGPFFRQLGAALAAGGHGVHRVNFNGGDWLAWRQPGAVSFRGRRADWPAALERLLLEREITDLVLFGDCRPMHRAAVAAARQLQIQVHVFEEGYIRPDWVTLELGGVNGHSSLPRDPDWYLDAARALPPLGALPGIASNFWRRARMDVAYNLGTLALSWAYPHFRTHRPNHIVVEYAGWLRQLARRPATRRRSADALARLAAGNAPYFVFPLQLGSDYQVRLHSPFGSMGDAIVGVLRSFARHAPAEARLVVKQHPLDNGLTDWRRVTQAAAAAAGLDLGRLLYLEIGDIAPLVAGARGVVTINSTTGTLALASGVPVVTLGTAVYDIPRITFQGELDRFWSAPEPPDPAVWDAFRRTLVARCLVRGGLFSEEGLALLVAGAAERLLEAGAALPRTAAAGVAEDATELRAAGARG